MKSLKLIITLATALVIISAAVCAVVIFQEELAKFYRNCKDYCCSMMKAQQDECDDFADL